MTSSGTPPEYDVAIVEALVLQEAAELHPDHLTANDLAMRIVRDPDDGREIEIANRAIRNLREFSLFSDCGDEIVVPTQAALRAVALLT